MKEGWKLKKFEDVVSFTQIGIVRNNKEQSSEFPYRYFKMNNIHNENGLNEDTYRFVNATNEEVQKFSLKNGDFLFNTRNSFELVGKTCLYESTYKGITLFNNNILRVNFKEFLIPKFVAYAFSSESISQELEKMKSGTTSVVGIYYKSLKNLLIPIPPISEQKQIVSILDEVFEAIDQAKAKIEKNIENTKELFQSKLNEIFSKKREGWKKKKIGEIAKFSQGIQVGLEHHEKSLRDGFVRFIRIVDYTQNTDDVRYVKDPGAKYFVNEEDIVMVRYGSPGLIGRGKAGVIANNLFKITIINNEISNDYLSIYLSQKHIQKFLSSQGSATMPALNFTQLKTVDVRYPSSNRQFEIVNQIQILDSMHQDIINKYELKKVNLEELKNSILQKAFSGELTKEEVQA